MKAQYESEELDLLSSIAAESNVGYTIFCWYTKIRQPLVLISTSKSPVRTAISTKSQTVKQLV